jgi:CRP-like cAMP-binding protein
MVKTDDLSKFRLFQGLDDGELGKITALCHERTLPEGTVCFTQGSKATDIHLCCKGQVDIAIQLPKPWDVRVTLHKVKSGEVFGWSALAEPPIYTASATCSETIDEIWIRGADLLNLFQQDSHIGYLVMKNLSTVISSRLREANQNISVEIANAIQTAFSDILK